MRALAGERVHHGTTSFPPEIALVLRCAAVGGDGAIALDPASFASVEDWPAVFGYAAKHAIAALVAKALDRAPQTVVPSGIRDQFHEMARQSAMRGLQLAAELLAVLKEFESASVKAIPIKGPTFAMLLYGDLSLRAYEDLDILVHERDLERAVAALQMIGYRFRDALSSSQRQTLAANAYHVGFVHDHDGTNLELHWLLNHRTLAHPELEARWWKHSQSLTLGGMVVRTLAPDEILLYLCMHGGKHSWARLNWLCDLRQALRSYPDADWRAIWRAADRNGVARMVATGLALVDELLDGTSLTARPNSGRPLDSGVKPLVLAISERLMRPGTEPREVDFLTQFWMRERFWDRMRYAAHVLGVPHHADVAQLGLPPSMRRMYYILRPARLAWKHLLQRAHRTGAV
ncbi:MAG: nucleotidyltransferase family protein [Chthoniobacterales bacterium]|nr:nucleotidyltransferase family protein [Chthoniobacterales bacterium]